MYVSVMSVQIGPGWTMILGGLLTWLAVGATVLAIPAIVTYPDGVTEDCAVPSSSVVAPRIVTGMQEELTPEDPDCLDHGTQN